MKHENEKKTLIWRDRSTWCRCQILALKELWLGLKLSPQLLNSSRVNFVKLPETLPYIALKVYKLNIFNTGKISTEQGITAVTAVIYCSKCFL